MHVLTNPANWSVKDHTLVEVLVVEQQVWRSILPTKVWSVHVQAAVVGKSNSNPHLVYIRILCKAISGASPSQCVLLRGLGSLSESWVVAVKVQQIPTPPLGDKNIPVHLPISNTGKRAIYKYMEYKYLVYTLHLMRPTIRKESWDT